MDERRQKILDEIVINEIPEFIQMLERIIDFKRWGFTRGFSGIGQFAPIVVYTSESCRVMFGWQIPDIRDHSATISVLYGRLHAPNDQEIIIWNGQKCYCWHDIRKPLFFLDGLTPTQAASDRFLWPKVMEQFRISSVKQGWTQPEYMAKMHATIWAHYGQKLFDLFDLREPSLWERYSEFIKGFHSIRQGFSLSGYPNRDKVC